MFNLFSTKNKLLFTIILSVTIIFGLYCCFNLTKQEPPQISVRRTDFQITGSSCTFTCEIENLSRNKIHFKTGELCSGYAQNMHTNQTYDWDTNDDMVSLSNGEISTQDVRMDNLKTGRYQLVITSTCKEGTSATMRYYFDIE